MKFENLYKTVESLKKSMGIAGKILGGILYVFLSILVFLLEIGIGGIIAIIIVVSIIAAIFEDIWDIVLIVGVIGIIAWIVIVKIKNSYQKKKEDFFQEETNEIIETKIKEMGSEIPKKLTYDLKYNVEERLFYPEYEKKMLPLSEQQAYYQEAYDKILALKEDIQKHYRREFYTYPINIGFYKLLNEKLDLEINYADYYRIYTANGQLEALVSEVEYEVLSSLKIVQNGNEGENRMRYALNLLKNQEDIIYLENVLLKFNNKSFETDFLVFSKYGVFSLEVKNIGSSGKFTIKITPDGQWLKVFNDGSSTPMQDVSSQLNYHVSLTEGLFKQFEVETGITAPKVYPIIILANNEVMLDNQANLPISRISKFGSDLTSKEAKYNMNDLKKLATWLEAQQLEDKKYEVSNCVNDLVKMFETIKTISYQYDQIEKLSSEIQINLRVKRPELLEKFKEDILRKGNE